MFQAPVSEAKSQNHAGPAQTAPEPHREFYPYFGDRSAPGAHAASGSGVRPGPANFRQLQSGIGNQAMRRSLSTVHLRIQAKAAAEFYLKQTPHPVSSSYRSGIAPKVQRKCGCGDTCSHCEAERKVADQIQTKLTIGPIEDPFEQEADKAAETVMRAPLESSSTIGDAGLRLQRSSCGSCEEAADGQRQIRRRSAGVDAPNIPALSPSTLTRGGAALPLETRQFFEDRFGRDFSLVRIHLGSESNELNTQLRSYAFAFGNHIWLGRGQTVGKSLLMAHELAHVVQQSGSPEKTMGAQITADSQGKIRRKRNGDFWYFEPSDMNGTATHAEVLAAIERANPGLLHEVPCPKGAEGLQKGQADLYLPRPLAIFGLWYGWQKNRKHAVSEQKTYNEFQNLPHPARLQNISYAPTAPIYDPLHQVQTLNRVADSPKEIFVGELKPIGEEAHKGVGQVQLYIDGLNNVGSRVKDVAGATFQLTASHLTSLTIPTDYDPTNLQATKRNLHIKRAFPLRNKIADEIKGRIAVDSRPIGNVPGRLVVQQDPQFKSQGIYNHFWVPDWVPVASLPRELRRLNDVQLEAVIRSLTRVPVGIRRKPLFNLDTQDSPRVMRASNEEAPKGIFVRDTFDYQAWKKDLDAVGTTFHKSEQEGDSAKSIQNVEAVSSAVDTIHDQGLGQNLEVPKDAKPLKRLQFWTGSAPAILGRFRQVFGGAMVNIARLFLWGREKFRTLIKNHQKSAPGSPGGAVGAIVKIIFKVAKYALAAMLPQITDRLWTSLTTGVKQKLLSLIPDSIAEEYEARMQQYQDVVDTLQDIAEKPVLEWLKDLVEPIEWVLDEVGKAAAALRTVGEIVNKIKWAIRLYNCATAVEGNVAGCVASFFGPAIDFLIEKIVENCSVRQTIIPHLLKLDFIRKTAPNWVADKLIGFARDLLPAGWEDILAKPDDGDYFPDKNSLPCKEEPTPLEGAMDQLAAKLGNDEDKIFALGELMNALGGDTLNGVTEAQVLEVADLVSTLNITAEQMRDYARSVTNPPKDIPPAFRDSMDNLFHAVASGEQATKEYETPGTASATDVGKEGRVAGAGGAQSGGGDNGEGKDNQATALRIPVADDLYKGSVSDKQQPRSAFKIIPLNEPKKGDRTTVDLSGYWDGKLWKTVEGVHVEVLSVDDEVIRFRLHEPAAIIIGPNAVLRSTEVVCYWRHKETDTRNCTRK